MTDTITLPRATVQQALERLMLHHRTWDARDDLNAITALRAALEQPDRAQKMRDAGYTRRPTLREMAEPELVNFPEEKLQAVAEYFGDKYHVWYGIGARDVEEVLRQSVRRGLVTLNFDTGEQPEQEPAKRATGWVAPKDHYTTPVFFNPYTGDPRDVRDVRSDPQGILIVPPGAAWLTAKG